MATAPKKAKAKICRPVQRSRNTARRSRQGAGNNVRALRQEFRLTRKALARMTGLSERTLASWEAGGKLNDTGCRVLTAVERLLRALTEVVRKEAIAGWLEEPNEGFGDLKPVEVLERDHADRVWRMIYHFGSGAAS
jgi:DNA-binding transcriptional regulator YiaG